MPLSLGIYIITFIGYTLYTIISLSLLAWIFNFSSHISASNCPSKCQETVSLYYGKKHSRNIGYDRRNASLYYTFDIVQMIFFHTFYAWSQLPLPVASSCGICGQNMMLARGNLVGWTSLLTWKHVELVKRMAAVMELVDFKAVGVLGAYAAELEKMSGEWIIKDDMEAELKADPQVILQSLAWKELMQVLVVWFSLFFSVWLYLLCLVADWIRGRLLCFLWGDLRASEVEVANL